MRSLIISALIAFFSLVSPVSSQDRRAMVISNTSYPGVVADPAAREDAELVADGLRALGFDVATLMDANLRFERLRLTQFLDDLRSAPAGSLSVIYYHGRGETVDGISYLLPSGALLDDVDTITRVGIDIGSMLVVGAGSQSVVIVDCCQANPFAAATGQIGQGIGELTAPEGVLLAYSSPVDVVRPANTGFANALTLGLLQPGAAVQDVLMDIGPHYLSTGIASRLVLFDGTNMQPEQAAWSEAVAAARPEAVMEFLEAYPDGRFARAAQAVFADLMAQEASDPAATANNNAAQVDASDVRFDTVLTMGAPEVAGQTIAELIAGSPLFPPIEGIPAEMWEGQECSACHAWERENLCEQANFYLSDAGSENLVKQHPYGGTFKLNLVQWALNGCG